MQQKKDINSNIEFSENPYSTSNMVDFITVALVFVKHIID